MHPTPEEHHDDLAPVIDLVSGDLNDGSDADPAEQLDTFFLCALMWGDRPTALRASEHVRPSDFYRSIAGEVFTVVRQLLHRDDDTDTQPHTAIAVMAELRRRGTTDTDVQVPRLLRYLTEIVTAGNSYTQGPAIHGGQAAYYGAEVIAASYRRAFRSAGDGLVRASETLPEDDLFEYMAAHGRRTRDIRDRLAAARAGSGTA